MRGYSNCCGRRIHGKTAGRTLQNQELQKMLGLLVTSNPPQEDGLGS